MHSSSGKTVRRAVATGDAGFIESHVVDRLVRSWGVKVPNNFSNGHIKHLDHYVRDPRAGVMKKGPKRSESD
jgi:UDP-glucose 4-epimerase